MKRKSVAIIIVLVMMLSLCLTGNATDVTNEREYKPLDLVVVMDTSGSMRDSDINRTAPDAVRMLVNMMPAGDSRVGIVSFNRQPTVLTTDAKGNATLVSLENFAGVEIIRNDISAVQYSGATGIGNAVFAATDLLSKNSDDDHAKAIILFTDGVNDFGGNQLALSECENNEVSAIKWAKENNCFIYCVGYDYIENGVSSMGANGEGLLKLQNISNSTNGKFKAIHSISEIEQLLIEFLADVCDLNYKTIATIPGDGKHHECTIAISPSVIEANIRIAGGTANAIANGKIKLFDPSGSEVELRNSNNIRFDTDATAASIKVMFPKTGNWLLMVDEINGDDIHVGLLEHFKMNLTSQLDLPEGNPEGVAYTNDVVGIKTWLTYDGEVLSEEALYDSVKSAEAVCISRADPNDKKTVSLTREGQSFVGSFTIPEDCFYDITIRLDWDTVYREDTLTVASSNKPVTLVKNIDDVKVNKGKSIQISDLYTYVKDDENDAITAYVKDDLKNDVCKLSIDDDVLTITGEKGWWAKTLVTIAFKDAQGNEVQSTFKVSVGDPWATVFVIAVIVLIITLIVLFIVFAFRSGIHLFGKMRVCVICEGEVDAAGNFTQDSSGFLYVNPNVSSGVSNGIHFSGGGGNVAQPVQNTKPATSSTNGKFGAGQSATSNSGGLLSNANVASAQQTGGVLGVIPTVDISDQSGQSGGILSQTSVAQTTDSSANLGGVFGGVSTGSETELSKGFNIAFDFGNKKLKKTSVESILDGFFKDYSDFMTRKMNSGRSELVEGLEKRLNSIRMQTSKMYLHGTIGGKGGAVLKIDKGLLKKKGITMTTPRLDGNKAELPYYDKGVVVLDFNVITDDKTDVRKGIRVCVELERS